MKKLLSILLVMTLTMGIVVPVASAEDLPTYKVAPYGTKLHIDGNLVDVENFGITEVKDGEESLVAISYKLRDIAALLKDSESKFNIEYDNEKKSIVITNGEDYIPLEKDLAKLDIEDAVISKSINNIIVDGKEYTAKELGGHVINGHSYYKMSTIANFLDNFMFQSNDDGAFIIQGETDIEDFSKESFEEILKQKEYTVAYIWGPWCYYSRQSMGGMVEGIDKYLAENDDLQVVGIISRYKNYLHSNLYEIYGSQDFSVKDFGGTSEAFNYFGEIYNTEITGVPFIIILDKDGNVIGKSNQDLADEVKEDYMKENNMTKEELEDSDEDYLNFLTKLYTEFIKRNLTPTE